MAVQVIERHRAATAGLSNLVQAELSGFFRSLDLGKPAAVRDALLEFVPLLVAEYGAVAETLALEYYDEMRAASGAAGAFRATAGRGGVPAEAVESKVRYLAGHLWTPTPEAMLGGLLVATDKYVKQPGRDAITDNAKREGVRWARVPQGKKTCSFCLVMASRDAAYATERSAGSKKFGESNRFHGKCDCEIVRIGKASDYPEDYLPDNYYNMYLDAANADDPEVKAFVASLPDDDKNKQLKGAVFALRRSYPGAVTDAVHTH